MNCRRIEELIPLYVEGDLEAGRIEEMRSHLGSCERCRTICDQYRESQSWLRSYSPPEFDAAFFDGLRRDVLAGIEREQSKPSFFQLIAREWRWGAVPATAIALLILFGAIALYIFQGRTGDDPVSNGPVAGVPAGKDEQSPVGQNQVPQEVVQPTAPRPKKRAARPRPAHARKSETRLPEIQPELISEVIETGFETAGIDPVRELELESGLGLIDPPLTPPGQIRIEIQTADPSIRIIWFAPKEADLKSKKSMTDSD